jgi:pimeloyl-ACP methyl ester carboxylesterase
MEVGKLSFIRNAAALNTNLTTEVAPLLLQIEAPTRILWGENDKLQRLEYAEQLAWDIPQVRLVRVPKARHFVIIDQPDGMRDQLGAFPGEARASCSKSDNANAPRQACWSGNHVPTRRFRW